MNALLLVALGVGAAVLSRRRPIPVALEPAKSYRLEYSAPYALGYDGQTNGSVIEDRQMDVRYELLPLSAYDIEFEGRSVSFTITPLMQRTLVIGAPLSSSATGAALVLESVTEVPNPGAA